MMTSLREMKFDLAVETARRLGDLGIDEPLAEAIRSKKNEEAVRRWVSIGREMISPDSGLAKAMAEAALAAKEEYLNRNPFALPIEEILARFRKANEEEGWGFDEEVFVRLLATAPRELPKGRDTFLSLRIRWGEGREGVIETFERHIARIRSVFGEKFWRWELLLSGEHPREGRSFDRLELRRGNYAHHATVDWYTVDLSENRERKSISAVLGSSCPAHEGLADEGLALAWIYPERVRAIEYGKYCAWYLAGYVLNNPHRLGSSWELVPLVRFICEDGEVKLSAHSQSDDSPGYSVPIARECKP